VCLHFIDETPHRETSVAAKSIADKRNPQCLRSTMYRAISSSPWSIVWFPSMCRYLDKRLFDL
jgi:hypothetical protein